MCACLYHPRNVCLCVVPAEPADLPAQYLPLLVTARPDEGAHGVSDSVLLTLKLDRTERRLVWEASLGGAVRSKAAGCGGPCISPLPREGRQIQGAHGSWDGLQVLMEDSRTLFLGFSLSGSQAFRSDILMGLWGPGARTLDNRACTRMGTISRAIFTPVNFFSN